MTDEKFQELCMRWMDLKARYDRVRQEHAAFSQQKDDIHYPPVVHSLDEVQEIRARRAVLEDRMHHAWGEVNRLGNELSDLEAHIRRVLPCGVKYRVDDHYVYWEWGTGSVEVKAALVEVMV